MICGRLSSVNDAVIGIFKVSLFSQMVIAMLTDGLIN